MRRAICAGLLLSVAWIAAVPMYARRDQAPSLELKDISGRRHKLVETRGQVVVLSFWATWCGPCREELPRLTAIRKVYAGKPVRVIAVSIDERKDQGKVRPFLDAQRLDLEVWVGGDTADLERFGLRDIVPGTVILNQEGAVLSRILGEATDEDLRSRIDWLLGNGSGLPPAPVVKRY